MRAGLIDLAEAVRLPRNSKLHDVGEIDGSMDEFGFIDRLIINEVTGRIVSGHGRLDALETRQRSGREAPENVINEEGRWMVPADWISCPADREDALAIRLNVSQMKGGDYSIEEILRGYETSSLYAVLQDQASRDLSGLGDDAYKALKKIMEPDQITDAAPEPDMGELLLEKWQVKDGEIWQIGDHRLICGDSTDPSDLDQLMAGAKADLMWTDPPYHVGKRYDDSIDEGDEWDPVFQREWQAASMTHLSSRAQRYICFAQRHALQALIEYNLKRMLVWGRPFQLMRSGTYDWAYDFIGWSYDGDDPDYFVKPAGRLSFDWQEIPGVVHGHEGHYHLAQKPLALPEIHIEASSPSGAIVLDPFCGSGTVMVVCQKLGRICYAVELSRVYCSIILERMSLTFPDLPVRRLEMAEVPA